MIGGIIGLLIVIVFLAALIYLLLRISKEGL